MYKKVRNRAKWFRSIRPGEVSGGQFKDSSCFNSISAQLAEYNRTMAKEKGVFVHAKYCTEVSCIILVGVTLEEREKEKADRDFMSHWRKLLDKQCL